MKTILAIALTTALIAPAAAYKIGGNVNQSAEFDVMANTALGSNVYARQDVNSIYDGGTVGGNVRQSAEFDVMANTALGSNVTACQSLNVIGQKDCSRR